MSIACIGVLNPDSLPVKVTEVCVAPCPWCSPGAHAMLLGLAWRARACAPAARRFVCQCPLLTCALPALDSLGPPGSGLPSPALVSLWGFGASLHAQGTKWPAGACTAGRVQGQYHLPGCRYPHEPASSCSACLSPLAHAIAGGVASATEAFTAPCSVGQPSQEQQSAGAQAGRLLAAHGRWPQLRL
jgi:hypothetical protein